MKGMKLTILTLAASISTAAAAPAIPASSPAAPQEAGCKAEGGFNFICGPQRPEDIVTLPGERWLVASGMAKDGGLHLIDVRNKRWQRWTAAFSGTPDPQFPDCRQPPAPAHFIAHGLALVAGRTGKARLYVTGHGDREAVEIFDIESKGAKPALAWRGCLLAPKGVEFNSVAAARDGTVLATALHLHGKSLADAFEGKATGAIFEWRPGYSAFREIAGTSLPANNGIALSQDAKTVYVAASGARQVVAFRRGKNWRKLWAIPVGNLLPDNLRWGPDGKLYTAGMVDDEPGCGGPVRSKGGAVDLMSCARGFAVAAISPRTRTVHAVLESRPLGGYAGTATAVPAGGYLWMSSFSVDRLAYRSWPVASASAADPH